MKLSELLDNILKVQEEIGSSKPYICGGVPRDRYLHRSDKISDLDITTGDKSIDYLSQEVAEKLKNDFNVTSKTMEDGHSSIYMGNLKVDFSSNFILPGIDGILQKMNIKNPSDMKKEIFSRDFTCNALLLDFNLKNVYDPTKRGFADLKQKKIKTCLDPKITLTANRNRVVRAIYLAAKLDFDIDKSIIDYVKSNPDSIKISTPKSLSEKLNAAFEEDADKSSYLLTQMNLWNYVPITKIMQPYYSKHVKGKPNVSK
jgi:tRNA nucleotidyltransferase/poly(A) polymerase